MSWESVGGVDEDSAYYSSFGTMKAKTLYYDPMNKIDPGQDLLKTIGKESFEKGVNVGAASGAAGYAFTPLVWDRQIVDITRKFTPLIGLIPKVTNVGKTAEYYRITARGSASWGTEQGSLVESDDTSEADSATIKYLRVKGRVTGVAQVAGAHFLDALQQQVVNKTQTMNEELEDTLVNGNSSTNTLQPDGLIAQLTTNNNSMNGGAITLAAVRDLVSDCFQAKGRPNLLITDTYTADVLHAEMVQYARYVGAPTMTTTQIAWGFETMAVATSIGKLPVVISQFMPTTAGSRRLLCINTDFIEYRVLQDVTFERLAKTEDAESFYLKTYRTLVNKFPEGMGQITSIA